MAKPDCDDGWIKVAHELFAALSCAGFNKWESVVIRETLHQVYGPTKKREATLSPTDIATRAGTFKESIVRAIRSLKASGVIVEATKGVRFVKDYERWTWDGKPRLNPVEVQYCKDAKPSNASTEDGNESVPHPSTNIGNESAHASTKPGNESVPISTNLGNESVPRRERKRSPAGTKALPVGNGSVPRAHSIERAELRIGELEKREKFAPAHAREEIPSGREGEDHREFALAVDVLRAHETTVWLADGLESYADTPGVLMIEGWRLHTAAFVVQRPDKTQSWNAFLSYARQATREELRKYLVAPTGKGKPDELQFTKAIPGWNQPRKATT